MASVSLGSTFTIQRSLMRIYTLLERRKVYREKSTCDAICVICSVAYRASSASAGSASALGGL